MDHAPPQTGRHPLSTRYSLLSRLQDRSDEEGWRDFFDTYWKLIYSIALKSGLTDAEAEDVVQETVICVAKDIHKFKRDQALGSFRGWLRNIIRWRIADFMERQLRAKGRNHPLNGEPDAQRLEEIPDSTATDLEAQWDREWQAHLFEIAVDRVKLTVKEEQYQIFDLYVLQQKPVRHVAERLSVSVGKIYLIKHRISSLIKKEVRRLEAGEFSTPEPPDASGRQRKRPT
jgi:RNA polymerase sigma factor (sigma-70 family)